MAKTLLLKEKARHSSRRTRGYALTTVAAAMAVAAAISLLAAIPGSAQTTPCDNTDVVGGGQAMTACEPTAARFGDSTASSATKARSTMRAPVSGGRTVTLIPGAA